MDIVINLQYIIISFTNLKISLEF